LYIWCAGSLGESTLMRAANAGDFDADMTTDLQLAAAPADNNTALAGRLERLLLF
jgi:GH24 family phage-related lysozyme (muramidase)